MAYSDFIRFVASTQVVLSTVKKKNMEEVDLNLPGQKGLEA